MSALAAESRMRNLQRAQRVRLTRSAHKQQIAALDRVRGEKATVALIAAPPEWLRTARLAEVAAWPRRRGKRWGLTVCERAGLPPDARVGDIGEALFAVVPQFHCGAGFWTEVRLVGLVRHLHSVLGRSPSRRDVEPHLRTWGRGINAIFTAVGGHPALLERAGLPPAQADWGHTKGAVPVALLQDAFARSRLTSAEVARRMGWRWSGRQASGGWDTSRVQRALGLRRESPGAGRPLGYRRHVSHDLAVRMIRAMDVDPVDVGL